MSHGASKSRFGWAVPALALGGIGLALSAWMLPINALSLPPSLVRAAGAGTTSTEEIGLTLLDSEKLGPAALVLHALETIHPQPTPAQTELATRLARAGELQPELVPWGGWDPFLDPLFKRSENRGRTESTPVLRFFVTGEARRALAGFLEGTRSAGVRSVLDLRKVDRTTQFVPAARPGGQALDAVVLLAALLYQGEHFSGPLQRDLRRMAEAALAAGELRDIEPFFLDLLSLGQRLDWTQLTELTRLVDSPETLREYAHLSRVATEDLAVIYAAALASDSADTVAAYVIRYGRPGLDDLGFALQSGRGAVQQLLQRQVPIDRDAGLRLGAVASLGILHPRLLLTVKYAGMLMGAFLFFRGLDRWLSVRTVAGGGLPHLSSGVLAILTAGVIIVATEPFLLRAAPPSEFQLTFVMPVLADIADTTSAELTKTTSAMDTSTLLSIGLFASLQVAIYLICLLKIGAIDKMNLSPLMKLRVIENEENLFDSGLYIGIGGTATALVMQVLGVIEPNLLAAYSSNLFGITCVALVKIRHVRPFKFKLILAGQSAIDAGQTAPAATR